jgi:hypothetical protein
MRTLTAILLVVAFTASAEEILLEDKGHRLRGGGSFEVGTALGWGGMSLRAESRVGYQISPTLGIFGLMAGGGSTAGTYGGQFDFGVVLEVMPIQWFYFGGGLVGSWGYSQVTTPRGSPDADETFSDQGGLNLRPAIDLRVGFATGRSVPPYFNRGGLSVGIHLLGVLHPDMYALPAYGGGFGIVGPTPRPAVLMIFTPAISFGFDFR